MWLDGVVVASEIHTSSLNGFERTDLQACPAAYKGRN